MQRSCRGARISQYCRPSLVLDCLAALAMTECGRGHRSFYSYAYRRHTFVSSRLISPELCFVASPSRMEEGAGKTGSRLAPIDPLCPEQIALQMHSGKQGNRKHPGLPCAMVGTAYVALSPGSDALLPPSPCGWRCACPVGQHASPQDLTHRLRAPGPHDLAVRRSHRSCARGVRSRLPALRSPSRRCALRPPPPGPRVVTIAIRPSSLGRSEAEYTQFRISVKWNIFAVMH